MERFIGLVLLLLASDLHAQEPYTRTGESLGTTVSISALGPDWDLLASATQEALFQLSELEGLVNGESGALAILNEGAGAQPQKPPEPLYQLLQRALNYCGWSEGRHGPLGGWLYSSWGLRSPTAEVPGTAGLAQRRGLAECNNLRLNPTQSTILLVAPAQLDLWGFERGFVVDSLLQQLVESGVTNVTVRVGNVQGARGPGPADQGWSLTVPLPSHLANLYDKIRLQDESLAIASPAAATMKMGGLTFPPFLDQRTGQPPTGVAATIAVTRDAVDAEAVAATMFIAGSRIGTHLVSQLRPAPSVLWWLGSGEGEGLLTDYHWSRVLLRPGSP